MACLGPTPGQLLFAYVFCYCLLLMVFILHAGLGKKSELLEWIFRFGLFCSLTGNYLSLFWVLRVFHERQGLHLEPGFGHAVYYLCFAWLPLMIMLSFLLALGRMSIMVESIFLSVSMALIFFFILDKFFPWSEGVCATYLLISGILLYFPFAIAIILFKRFPIKWRAVVFSCVVGLGFLCYNLYLFILSGMEPAQVTIPSVDLILSSIICLMSFAIADALVIFRLNE